MASLMAGHGLKPGITGLREPAEAVNPIPFFRGAVGKTMEATT